MNEIAIAVSGINAVDNPGPGVGVVKSLKEDQELQVKVSGLAYDAMEPGIYLDWLMDRSFVMPYPSSSGADYLARLLYIKESAGLDLVIPTLDAELPFYIKNESELAGQGIITYLPSKEQFDLRSKDRLADVADKIGLAVPPTEIITSHSELASALDRVGFPAMIKGIFYKAYRVHSYLEAESAFYKIVNEWGYPVLVQKIVQGDEINVIGLGDGTGGSLGTMAIKKLGITDLGKIWTGVTIENEAINKATGRFLDQYGWRGAFEIECIASDNKIYLIEINPRFPAWVYFATGAGINLPARLLRAALKLPFERESSYTPGRLYIRYTDDLVTDADTFQKIITRGES